MQKFDLTEEQEEAISTVMDIYDSGDIYAQISGAAGTGKTTLALELMRRAEDENWTCYLTAPTNKAAKVLAEKTGQQAKTIHKLLHLVLTDVEDKQELRQGGEINFEDYMALVIIDEASMLTKEIMELIADTVMSNDNIKILFLGDPYQLNPINEEISGALEYEGYELVTVMRQAEGNPIIDLAHKIRKLQLDNPDERINFWDYIDEEKIISYTSPRAFADTYLEDFRNGVIAHLIAWRNEKVVAMNNYCRRELLGAEKAEAQPYYPGEYVMTYAPVILYNIGGRSQQTVLDNSAYATVHSIEESVQRPVDIQIDSYTLELIPEDNPDNLVRVHIPKDPKTFENYLQTLVAKAKAAKDAKDRGFIYKTFFYPTKNHFAQLRPAHAITTHKSQGSTFTNAYVNVQDIMINRNKLEMLRCLYVAITRPSTQLHLYGIGRKR